MGTRGDGKVDGDGWMMDRVEWTMERWMDECLERCVRALARVREG
jgi:hypothetical protein